MKIFYTAGPYKIYVEELVGNKNFPTAIFIHGAFHSGVCYVQTPDGRKGWGPLLCEKGYNVLITDMPDVGRSGAQPFGDINGEFIVKAYLDLIKEIKGEIILFTHSLSGALGYRIGELSSGRVTKIVSIEPSLPGNLEEPVKPYFESNNLVKAKLKQLDIILKMDSYSYASDQIIASFINGGTKQFPDDKLSLSQYVSSLQKIHPRLLYERLNINNSQINIEDYVSLRQTKCLVITSPNNPVHIFDDKRMVDALKEQGVFAEHYKLNDVGIYGNGHMMMIEKNNAEVLELIVNWLEKA